MSQTGFWKFLPQEATQLILSSATYFDYKRHDKIYTAGDVPKGIYVIKAGLVGLVALTPKGSEHLLRLFKPNDFFGHRSYFAKELHHANSICLEPSSIGLVNPEIIEKVLVDFPSTQRILIETLAKELGIAELQRIRVTDQEVLQRIASALIYLKEIHPNHNWTRSEIAQFCASTTPTIIRGLAELEKQKMIKQIGRQIEISNRNALILLSN